MASTTAALVARTRDLCLQAGTRSTLTDPQLVRNGLNPAFRDVIAAALAAANSATISLAPGSPDYPIAAALETFVRAAAVVYGAARRPLLYRDRELLAQMTGAGEPEYWGLWGGRVWFRPTPAAAATVYLDAYAGPGGASETADPAAAADEFGLDRAAEDALVYRAAAIICGGLVNEGERAARYDRKYDEKIALLRQRLAPDGGTADRLLPTADADGMDIY